MSWRTHYSLRMKRSTVYSPACIRRHYDLWRVCLKLNTPHRSACKDNATQRLSHTLHCTVQQRCFCQNKILISVLFLLKLFHFHQQNNLSTKLEEEQINNKNNNNQPYTIHISTYISVPIYVKTSWNIWALKKYNRPSPQGLWPRYYVVNVVRWLSQTNLICVLVV